MWKVFLAFVTHRMLLLMVAVLTLQYASNEKSRASVWSRILDRVSQGPEVRQVETWSRESASQVIRQTRNPFHWICLTVKSATGWRSATALLMVSNIFLFLFLAQLFTLFTRMVTTDVSTVATIFVLLWPTSYELSLGSSLTLACFLLTLGVRQALEQNWLAAGLATAVLALIDPISLALLPAFAYLFWSIQRFLPVSQWGRNLAYFLVPLVVGIGLSGRSWSLVLSTLDQSAFLALLQFKVGANQNLFSEGIAGQTVSVIFFFLGAAGALFSNVNPLHRFLPMLVLLGLLMASPYTALASRAPLAGICMEGVASACSGSASRIANIMMIFLGAYEVYSLFL